MRPNPRNLIVNVASLAILSIAVSACSSSSVEPTAQEVESSVAEDEHEEEEHMDEHAPEEHMEGGHEVPDEAATVPNPFAGDDVSTATGAEFYALNCAVCHGETGEGDGPAAESFEKPPADLHAGHVQGLTDGALFYIISHGKPDTPMPAWENVLDEDQRWQVVNFLRTFQQD